MVEQRETPENLMELVPTTTRRVQCVGPSFLKFYQQLRGGGISEDASDDEEAGGDRKGQVVFMDNVAYLRGLNPKEWKDQDHYAVLGLKWLRHKASDDVIKQAFRAMVLKHHPDKRKAAGEEVREGDDYFTCISRAWEMLGSKEKRRAYDSVDPQFDDSVPSNNDESRKKFFETFGPVFDRNARWSEKKPVPKLGGVDATREHVERFYKFWYNFESWREYSYYDEDEKGQDRDERRYIDKQNKAARAKLKKEEMARIRSLVDTAYQLDPRIAQFVNDDKEKRLAGKRAKQEAARAKYLEEERLVREAAEKEKQKKEALEAEERARQNEIKQERAEQKRLIKQKRKLIRDFCKNRNYFVENESEMFAHMTGLDNVCEMFQLDQLTRLFDQLQISGRDAFLDSITTANKQIESERLAHIQTAPKEKAVSGGKKSSNNWTPANLQLLIKAVNLFPAGTNQRWEVVATFINQHAGDDVSFTAKEVLAKAKDLQNDNFSRNVLKESANEKAFDNFEKEKKVVRSMEAVVTSEVTQRFDSPAEQQGLAPWTKDEQQLLEQALRTFGPSTSDRWDQIAACVPGRSKKDCMRRFKELAEMVKAKKAAQAAAAKS